jgi:hypothetical protein
MVELKIAINDAGQVAITGPIDNEMLVYYLLEKTRQAVAAHHEKVAQRIVQPATALPFAPPARGNGHG